MGALVGFIGSVAGAVFVGRHEITRAARIRIYQELLPPLIDEASSTIWERTFEPRPVQDLYRASVLAGRNESRLALRVVNIWTAYGKGPTEGATDEEGDWVPTNRALAEWDEHRQQLIDSLMTLESFLEKRIARKP